MLPKAVNQYEFGTIVETGMIPIDYDFPTLTVPELLGLDSPHIQFPRSVEKPLSFDDTDHAESLSFPWLFPTGRNDYDEKRDIKLTMLDYLQSRILHEDNRFRCDIPYLITSVNRFEKKTFETIVRCLHGY